MNTAPKVFVSHASEDKARFVTGFALKLRQRGVDAWLDKWEMLPGDSLVGKIFEEGIKNARAVVVVISKNSIGKPWVREELNAAVVNKINGASKLIPVVIDDCEVPQCLQSTLWERINSLEDYAVSLDRIVMSIFGHSARPPLGVAPKFLQSMSLILTDLDIIDSTVLRALCEVCVETDSEWIKNTGLFKLQETLDIGEEPFREILDILESRGYVELKRIGGVHIGMAMPTVLGFDGYFRATREDYPALFKIVGLKIINERTRGGMELLKATALPSAIVNHVVRVFENRGWLTVSRHLGPGPCGFVIHGYTAELKRWLQDQ